MRKLLYLPVFLFAGFALSGCNTTRGFGQDVEATGDAIEEAAEDTEEELEE